MVTIPPKGYKKYVAHLQNGSKVSFGDRRYEQFTDSVPKINGGGQWSNVDHKMKIDVVIIGRDILH